MKFTFALFSSDEILIVLNQRMFSPLMATTVAVKDI